MARVSEISDLRAGLEYCLSRPHRAVLALVRAAVGRPVDGSQVSDLEASDPADIVRIATFNYVHVVLATGFERAPELAEAVPRDLVIFFEEMRRANLRRNSLLSEQLRDVGAALADANLHAVALKGGAELAAPLFPEPAFRFLSDLDILLPEAHIGLATEALHRIGARSDDVDEINVRDHHHVAPLRHDDWLVQVELHRALAQGAGQSTLPADQVLQMARPSDLRGLFVPTPADRLTHSVLHAQFSPPRYRDDLLSLRDILELEILMQRLSQDEIAEARARFSEKEASAAWAALDASRALVLGDTDEIEALSPDARAWAERAIAGFGRPERRRASTLLGWAGWYAKEVLVNPERRAHYVSKIRRPGALSRALAHHRDNWRRTR
jgi:hypothetical protein